MHPAHSENYDEDGWVIVPNSPNPLYDQEFRDVFNSIDVMFLESIGIEPYAEATWTKD